MKFADEVMLRVYSEMGLSSPLRSLGCKLRLGFGVVVGGGG